MKIARIAALAALLLGAAALVGVGRPDGAHGKGSPSGQAITVTATGTIEQVPDRAQLGFAVVTRADTAKQTLDASSAETRRMVDALRRAGIDAKSIQTQDVSLDPHFTQDGNRIDGYTARNSVTVLSPIGRAGPVVDAAVAAGANEISGPSLSVSDRDRLYQDALKDAVRAARAKATAIAQAAGVQVGAVTNVVENGGEPQPYAYQAASLARSAPIEPGTQKIEANVTVTFAIA
jgi:uncharacterized protein YggE